MNINVSPQRLSNLELLHRPNISLNGKISAETLSFFLEKLGEVRASNEQLVMELNTEGGDADVARRIAMEIRLFLRYGGKEAYCVGKTNVYSAGVTIFAAFPRNRRFLTEDAVLLIHERRLSQSVQLCGPIKASIQIIREQLSMLETAHRLEMEGFRELVEGSKLSVDELYERATSNCYLHAKEALDLRLIAEILE
jgi:ATP-dependent protease ClpP protease subunit